MSEERVDGGRTRTDGYSKMYHEIFDEYHPHIGDKATLYYLYLLRYRNNQGEGDKRGKSWVGRERVAEEFNMNYAQLKRADAILESFDLIRIERINIGRGRPKNIYYVNHPLEKEKFPDYETAYIEKLRKVCADDPKVINMLGKGRKGDYYAY